MDTILTLLIYNPLEAFFLIRFCDIVIGRNFIKNDICKCYILGIINYFIQVIPNIFYGTKLFVLIEIFCMCCILPMILFIFYNIVICRIRPIISIIAYSTLHFIVLICCFIIIPQFTDLIYYINIPFVICLIESIILFCIEIMTLNIIKAGVSYEKHY